MDRFLRVLGHYLRVRGNLLAGAISYFGFLSFFPLLALALFAVGFLSQVYPDARSGLNTALEQLFPGLVGSGSGEVQVSDIEALAGRLGLIGLVGAVYTGLGWLSAMRTSLLVVFELPREEQPNFLVGKARDLSTLLVLFVCLTMAVAFSSLVAGFSRQLLDWLSLSRDLSPVLAVLAIAVGLLWETAVFYLLFTLLARPRLTRRALWGGALLGAVGFELLKWLSTYLLQLTSHQPAVMAFGVTLILLVWINYFSRIALFAASWAQTPRRPLP